MTRRGPGAGVPSCSRCPTDFGLAAAVLDLPVGETAMLLESLVDVRQPVRHFARGRVYTDDGPEASQAALTRLVRFHSTENGGVRASL